MTRTAAVAFMLLMAATAAKAGDSYSFDIGDQNVTIDAPKDCKSADCISISIPGVFEYNTKRVRDRSDRPKPVPPTTTAQPTAPPPAATPPAPAPSDQTIAAAPVTEPAAKPAPAQTAAPSPLGIWMTEKNEGKIRIEPCGSNLCGYAMDKTTDARGDEILIDMKPSDDKWAGKIFDPKSRSTYQSTIALKGNDTLDVKGCAMGGLFCGGQTWTRVN